MIIYRIILYECQNDIMINLKIFLLKFSEVIYTYQLPCRVVKTPLVCVNTFDR